MGIAKKWKKMGKAGKVGAIAAAIGGGIIAVPFIIAAGPLSIVSALAIMGGGTLAAGGLGVAGGIIVTGGGAALSAGLAAAIASKKIIDPELTELQNNFKSIEELIAKLQVMEKNNLGKYKVMREKYIKLAEFINKAVTNTKKLDKDDLKRNLFESRDLLQGLSDAA